MLNNLKSPKTIKNTKRKGRGYGSGVGGHTVGRGQKGQKSRSGYSAPRRFFEGGSNPLAKRFRKLKGFSRSYITSKYKTITINFSDLNKLKDGVEINSKNLKELGFSKTKSKTTVPKILAKGKLERKVNVVGISVSEKAKKEIEKLGGSVK
ncbi:MAG TPA: 50S ribosomal protein L15 [Candidatus Dojkabacteria bacterium]|jgi:large subunit ribosomal protein L15